MHVAEPPTSVLSVCPFCACGCGLYLREAAGAIAGVMPSEHHPVSGGRLCARGWAAHEAAWWGPRLTRPLVRDGGAHAPVTWDAALAAAADRLTHVLASGGSIGVLGSGRATNEENFLTARLARCALQTSHVDACLRSAYQALAAGLRGAEAVAGPAPAIADLEQCDLILLLEEDLARTHPRVAFAVMRAVGRGGRVVTMGPARTQMSRLAWLHLPLIPGDEPVLAARIAVAAAGASAPPASPRGPLRSVAAGAPPGDAHLMASAELRQAVDAYATARRAAVVLAPTGAAAPALHAVASAFTTLAVATGHARREGSVLLPLPVRSNTCGALEMGAAPNCLPGLSALDDEPARRRLRQAWGTTVACRRGLDAGAMVGEVDGLIVVADEPGAALPSGAAYRRWLAGLDCVIVLDAFATPTVAACHVALPIASPAESTGTYTNLEGRVQRLHPVVAAPGDARPGWWALGELAAALGLARTFDSVIDVQRDIAAAVPSYAGALAHRAETPEPAGAIRCPVEGSRATESDYAGDVAPAAGSGPTRSFPFRLVTTGVIDWGADPLVDLSPTLCRDYRSRRKGLPDGVVEMSARDAGRMGIRSGWRVKLTSAHGEVVVPVSLREDLEPGILLAPFAFRDQLQPVLSGEPLVGVNLERT